MAKAGTIEPGLYPEFHYMDEELRAKDTALLTQIYTEHHAVYIHGIRFDDKYFDEYRTDLTLPTTEERINWLATVHRLGQSTLKPGRLANWKVENPQPVGISDNPKPAE